MEDLGTADFPDLSSFLPLQEIGDSQLTNNVSAIDSIICDLSDSEDVDFAEIISSNIKPGTDYSGTNRHHPSLMLSNGTPNLMEVQKQAVDGLYHCCTYCNEVFCDQEARIKHTVIHTGLDYSSCDRCVQGFSSSTRMHQHMASHIKIPSLIYTYLGIAIQTEIALSNNMLAYNKKGVHLPMAGSQLQPHQSRKISQHVMDRRFSCPHCSANFKKEKTLIRHMKTHKGVNSPKCPFCNRIFATVDKLKLHIISHSGTRYTCEVCDKTFNSAGNLKQHMNIHASKRPYQCKICHKEFNFQSNYKSHMSVHSEDRKYKCVECGKGFKHLNSLKKHMLHHTGERPYTCPYCNQGFAKIEKMRHHIGEHLRDDTGALNQKRIDVLHKTDTEAKCNQRKDLSSSTFRDQDSYEDEQQSCPVGSSSNYSQKVKSGQKFLHSGDHHTKSILGGQAADQGLGRTSTTEQTSEASPETPDISSVSSVKTEGNGADELAINEQSPAAENNDNQGDDNQYCDNQDDDYESDDSGDAGSDVSDVSDETAVEEAHTTAEQDAAIKQEPVSEIGLEENRSHHIKIRSKEKMNTPKGRKSEKKSGNWKNPKRKYEYTANKVGGKMRYQCTECDKSYTDPSTLRRHILQHKDTLIAKPKELPYQCQQCGRKFLEVSHLESHVKTHEGENLPRLFWCTECTRGFKSAGNLRQHMAMHQDTWQYKCAVCNKGFNFRSNMMSHMRTHSDERKYDCQYCGKKFKLLVTLKSHVRLHTGEKPFVCPVCQRCFTQVGNMRSHLKSHSKEDQAKVEQEKIAAFKSSRVSTKSSSRNEVAVNNKKEDERRENAKSDTEDGGSDYAAEQNEQDSKDHDDEQNKNGKEEASNNQADNKKRHKCHFCGQDFLHLESLTRHIQIHADDQQNLKVHFCQECGKGFKEAGNLKQHMRVHREPELKCNICDRMFRFSATLKTHMLSHSDERNFTCDTCGKAFKMADTLKKHIRLHTGEKPFKCEKPGCGMSFKQHTNLTYHINKSHSEVIPDPEQDLQEGDGPDDTADEAGKRHNCKICGQTYMHFSSLKNHMLIHKERQQPRLHLCPECGKGFAAAGNLKQHMLVHQEKQLQCEICNKMFRFSSTLKSHMFTHSEVRNHQCPICGKAFKMSETLKKHIRVHTGEKPFKCKEPGCDKAYAQIGNLKSHVKHTHCKIRSYQCSYCPDRWFVTKSEVTLHERTHTGEKPFVCTDCGKTFARSQALKLHMTVHTGERKFVCEICNRAFKAYSTLKAHKRTHTDERPFQCTTCGKCYAQQHTLTMHQRTVHMGLRNYECDKCDLKFGTSSNLYAHLRTHSGEKPYICSICGWAWAQKGNLLRHMASHKRPDVLTAP